MKKQLDCKALQQGLSLVELAIVLVIIGLLTGGILSMRSYVFNAQLNTMMNETKYYTSAFNQFQTRYGSAPGDFSTASTVWPSAGNGDGNGIIRGNGGSGNPAEYYYAFQHLVLAGFIEGTYTGLASSYGGATRGVNIPASTLDTGAYAFTHTEETDGFVSGGTGGLDGIFFDGMYGNLMIVASVPVHATDIANQALLTSKDALKIDTKYDDGMPGTGNITVPIHSIETSCATSNVAASATYVINAGGKACFLFIKMQ